MTQLDIPLETDSHTSPVSEGVQRQEMPPNYPLEAGKGYPQVTEAGVHSRFRDLDIFRHGELDQVSIYYHQGTNDNQQSPSDYLREEGCATG